MLCFFVQTLVLGQNFCGSLFFLAAVKLRLLLRFGRTQQCLNIGGNGVASCGCLFVYIVYKHGVCAYCENTVCVQCVDGPSQQRF